TLRAAAAIEARDHHTEAEEMEALSVLYPAPRPGELRALMHDCAVVAQQPLSQESEQTGDEATFQRWMRERRLYERLPDGSLRVARRFDSEGARAIAECDTIIDASLLALEQLCRDQGRTMWARLFALTRTATVGRDPELRDDPGYLKDLGVAAEKLS